MPVVHVDGDQCLDEIFDLFRNGGMPSRRQVAQVVSRFVDSVVKTINADSRAHPVAKDEPS